MLSNVRHAQIQASLEPFLTAVLEFGPLMDDPAVCDFMAGNPEVPALPGYVEAVQRWLEPQHRRWFAYGTRDRRAAEAAAGSLSEELGVPFDPEDVVLTRGATGALALALTMVLDADDEVVFVSPPWFFYEAMILGAGATPVRVRADERTWDLDLAAIRSALTPRTRVVLINTPHNPTGRIYPAGTLDALGAMLDTHGKATGRGVHLLSDESYSTIRFDGHAMRSPATSYPRTLVTRTLSKSTLAPGQRIGYLGWTERMPDRAVLRKAAMTAAFATGNHGPDAAMWYALPDLLGITVDVNRLQQRRDRLLRALRAAGYEAATPEGTFYLLVRSPIADDLAFARRLAVDNVVVAPGRMFELPGYFRISLTATDAMVDRAIPIFRKAIRSVAK